uniref:DNA-directed RNA polymerase III subunit RPC5 n=1 Tax=Leersia perrieri TaxID=77586 RepID=A0A0D9X636_9ORYZ
MAPGGGEPPSLDADIDMDDLATLDAPASSDAGGGGGGAPSTRFRPKAKGKPKPKPNPKPETKAEEPESKPMAEEPDSKPKAEDPKPEAAAPTEDSMEVDEVGTSARASASASAEGEGDDEVEDEDDFVVREIDVYFTPKPFDEDTMLYVMQYPLRPCWRPYELNEICKEIRVKPLSSKVEVDLHINTECENYDPEVSSGLTEQTLSSSKADDVADYAVGVLQGNLVHLNHIDAVMQLRPSMLHINSGRSNARLAVQHGANSDASGSTMPSVKRNGHSEDSKDHTEESEPWISLTYEPARSNIARKYHAEMISNEGGPIDFTMSTSEYVTSLCPGGSTGSRNVNRSHAIREMLKLPLEERLKKWFTEVSQVTKFDALMHLAPTYSEDDVLKVLPVYADLVRGLWVCKSSLLFDDGVACKRDRILLEFTKKDSIPLKDIDRLLRVDDLRLKGRILVPLCKKRLKLGDCKFISPVDSSFIKRYPHVVKEQDHAWSVRETTMHDSQETSSNTEARKTKNSTKSNIPSKGPGPNTTKARDGPVEGIEGLVHSVLDTIFTANKVRSIQAVRSDLRQLAARYASDRKGGQKLQALSKAATTCVHFTLAQLQKSLEPVAVLVHGVYVAKPTDKKSPRHLLIELFRDKDPNAKLTKQEILDGALNILKRQITEKEYHQHVTEICILTEDGHLVLKNGPKY